MQYTKMPSEETEFYPLNRSSWEPEKACFSYEREG